METEIWPSQAKEFLQNRFKNLHSGLYPRSRPFFGSKSAAVGAVREAIRIGALPIATDAEISVSPQQSSSPAEQSAGSEVDTPSAGQLQDLHCRQDEVPSETTTAHAITENVSHAT